MAKKSNKEASALFHNIMAASVNKSLKLNKSALNRQDRYESLYKKVESEMKEKELIKSSLLELCSILLDRNVDIDKIYFEFLLESTTDTKIELKKVFDKRSKEYGFAVEYVNLMGELH